MVPMELTRLHRFRSAADAAASPSHVGIGGTRRADVSWFSVQLTAADCPWAFDTNFISTHIDALELLATFPLLMAAKSDLRGTQFAVGLPNFIDNQGNSFVLSKMFTMKQPAASVLMAMNNFCMTNLCMPIVNWVPREENIWADELSKGMLSEFATENRVRVDLTPLRISNELVQNSKLPLQGALQDASP